MNLSRFLKENKKSKEGTTFRPTVNITDENGEPAEFKLRPITTRENNEIMDKCTIDVPVTGKPGQTKTKFLRFKYMAMVAAASVVEPDLYNAELQDSYGVQKPEDLIQEMIDEPGEFSKFFEFISEFNGFDKSINEDVEEAKN